MKKPKNVERMKKRKEKSASFFAPGTAKSFQFRAENEKIILVLRKMNG